MKKCLSCPYDDENCGCTFNEGGCYIDEYDDDEYDDNEDIFIELIDDFML